MCIAAALAVVMAVDPVGVGTVATGAAYADTVTEDRASNFADALGNLPATPAAPVTAMGGSWPQADEAGLPLPATELPASDEATVELSDSAATADLGGMAVEVVGTSGGASPDAVTLKVEDQAIADAVGVTGVLLDVVDATPGDTTGAQTVDLTLSYAAFAGAVGGDWASRLRLVRVPDCARETPNSPECQPEPIPSTNDPIAQTVTGTVPVESSSTSTGGTTAAPTTQTGLTPEPASLAALATSTMEGSSIALAAGAAGAAGDWSQTGLSPSSTWGASGNTGAFTWSYPLNVPEGTGPSPDLTLSYSSAVSDGRVPSANNQSGWIGEGFDLTSSYVERQYKPCSDDAKTGSNNVDRENGDLCWGPANATLMFNGAASPLVYDSVAKKWSSKTVDGSRVELLTGGWNGVGSAEYWKVTTADGTQYFFGRGKATSTGADLKSAWSLPVYGNDSGEACYKAAADGGYAASRCNQVWRWNLDHVVDPSGNTMTYSYATESNSYVADYANNTEWKTTSYTSGGRLTKIEYGTRTGSAGSAPYRVVLGTEARCVTDRADGTSVCTGGHVETDKSRWLDTPTDLQCTATTTECKNVTPVFFDTTRLVKITAQSWDGSAYQDIDSWAFTHRYVGEGDAGLMNVADAAVLRLDGIRRTGRGGTTSTGDDIALPPVEFTYTSMPNRVDSSSDGQPGLWRPRIIRVRTDSGGAVNAAYRTECDASSLPATTDAAQAANTKLCYLVKWQPDGELTPQNHWFHKYVVESIVEDAAPEVAGGGALITGSVSKTTRFSYLGGAKWVKPTGPMIDADQVTYSDFRGFAQVATVVGEGTEQTTAEKSTYFRGSGATLTAGPTGYTISVVDRDEYTGQVFASETLNGTTKVSETISQPAAPVVVVTGASGLKTTRIPSTTTFGFTYNASGGLVYRTSATTTNDTSGLPISVDDRGDLTSDGDNVCTKTTYRRDGGYPEANKLSYAAKTEVFGAACSGTLTVDTLISRETATYDDAGRTLETKSVDPGNGAADIVRTKSTYDASGRAVTTEDAAGNVTTMAYTLGAGGQLAKVGTTSPDPDGIGEVAAFTSTQAFNPLTGMPISTTDQNGKVTKGTYDSLGRPTSVVYPQHAAAPKPSIEYAYVVATNGLNAVITRTLGADGKRQHTSVVLYDGMLRPFQSQVESADATDANPGRSVSHVYYDSAGRTIRKTAPWSAQGWPNGDAIVPIAVPPAQATYVYDKAGRITDEVFWIGTYSDPANEKWRTTTSYDGAATLTIPPKGGVPTETVVDALGRTIQLREYLRDPATQTDAVTAAAVRALPKQTTSYAYDAAGRLLTMTNPAGDVWKKTYDAAGQLVSSTDPDAGVSASTYDILGRVSTRTDANGATLAYTYDKLGRVTSLRDGNAIGAVRASWTYDAALLQGGETRALGQVSSSTRVVGGKEYTTAFPVYDSAYRPLEVDTILPADTALNALSGATFTTAYAYAADGQVAQTTYPQVKDGSATVLGAETVTTRFDERSKPSWMGGGFGWGVYVADAIWTHDGKPLAQDLGNTYGASVSYDWEAGTNRLNAIRLDRQNVDGTEVDTRYSYDAAGNVTGLVDAPSRASVVGTFDAQCFRYDSLRRLKTAWTAADKTCGTAQITQSMVGGASPYWTDYEYDPLGNRTKMTEHAASGNTVTTYQHGDGAAGPHQLTSMTKTKAGVAVTTGFTWDAAGNQTSRTVNADLQTQTWDPEGELVSVTGGAEDLSNVFDANGVRLLRSDDSGVTVFLPGGQEVRASATAVSATRWYSFGGANVAVRTGTGMAGVSSVVSDAHGTPLAYVHNTNWTEAVRRVRTDPFGAARADAVGTLAGRGFLGAPADSSGLTLLGARFFDPGTGTFLSTDPELSPGVPAQFNAYVYSGNNPVTWSDPSGRNWFGNLWNSATKFVKKYQAEIAGAVVGTLVTAGCLVVTAGAGSVGCAIAGGAAGAATTNIWKQSQSKKPFDFGSFARDTVMGAAVGWAMGPIASVAGKVLPAVANRLTAAVTSAFKPLASRGGQVASGAVRPPSTPLQSIRPSSGAKPAASGGGSKPMSSCAVNSFVPGTSVLMADGAKKPIEKITLGDLVLATDPETGKSAPRPVIATITGTGEKDLVTVTVTDPSGMSGQVTATDGHPFWVPDTEEWVDAGDLRPGMWVQTSSGTWVQVTAVQHDHREQTVHNLTIDTTHTYSVYAGDTDVLTHNCGNSAGAPKLPSELSGGHSNTSVYLGVRSGDSIYAGITNNITRRTAQHGDRFDGLQELTASPLTRGESRAIEQALIVDNPGFQNLVNSISPRHSYYEQAVEWGRAWLSGIGG
ncbi:polymorphic toxin-type HINT domain-containing protein [Microbacterium sp. SD291]|uniref:polymorphic toxin-type HINT domain-containing protein n=1 Tax=Microbacterium sp. SD291 TaxID=2782007 RepID=UPI001A9752F4|nr:polymorphic toxin-type HINT domain-containing protein [Microbacterium sp. SD291]MBO0981296.1 hypothetical protein [Microbacterium sp. SD291]